MKKESIKYFGRILAVFVLCAVFLSGSVFAAEQKGSFVLTLEDGNGRPQSGITVQILRAADENGILSGAFRDAALTDEQLTMERYSRLSAGILLNHAEDRQLEGVSCVSGQDGRAEFSGMDAGIYVVYCQEGQALTFEPFLINMPSSERNWNLRAEPKTEEPENPQFPDIEEPEDPESPGSGGDTEPEEGEIPGTDRPDGEPEVPIIPQTGENYWTVWILLGSGILMSGCGIWCLRKDREAGHE